MIKNFLEIENVTFSAGNKSKVNNLSLVIENEGDTEAAMEELDALIVQALGAAQKQGNIPHSFLEVIQELTRPKIDLETLLHTYVSESYLTR